MTNAKYLVLPLVLFLQVVQLTENSNKDPKAQTLRNTGKNEHVSVVGSGGFLGAQDSGGEMKFCRSGVLCVNGAGMLCVKNGEERLVLEPGIALPGDVAKDLSRRLFVRLDGSVMIADFQANGIVTVGCLSLFQLNPGQLLPEKNNSNLFQSEGPPMQSTFGGKSESVLIQGWQLYEQE